MKLKKIIAVHLLVLGLVFPHAVSAEDFVINVKVKLDNIVTEVTDISINCRTWDNTVGGGAIGESEKKINMPANGSLNTTIQVKFNADPGKNPRHANMFNCKLWFFKGTTNMLPNSSDTINCKSNSSDWFCAQPDTPFTWELGGEIP